jgi:glucose/mannose-6-phosphate isomerase
LPPYVGKDSLVVLSSYSGSTEETLSCMKEVAKRGSKVIVITNGKDLAAYKQKNKLPGYLFTPHFNPCNSPRMGLGYTLFGTILLFGKLELIKFGEVEIKKAIKTIEKYNDLFGVKKGSEKNPAKKLAQELQNKIPIYFSSGFLAGSIHTAANQLNENAKNFAAWFLIPESNHHLMEGLVFPAALKSEARFVFFESSLNEERIQKRFALTKEIAGQKGIGVSAYSLQEKTKLGQVFEMLVLGSYVSFYLAMLYGIDPIPIPVVDWFKKELK